PRIESLPRITIGWKTSLSLPVLTYFLTIGGRALFSNSAQNGHWRSAKIIIVAGAEGDPSTFPFCGMPANSLAAAFAEDEDVAGAGVEAVLSELPPPEPAAIAIATATTAA